MFINANDASVEGEAALPLFIPPFFAISSSSRTRLHPLMCTDSFLLSPRNQKVS